MRALTLLKQYSRDTKGYYLTGGNNVSVKLVYPNKCYGYCLKTKNKSTYFTEPILKPFKN